MKGDILLFSDLRHIICNIQKKDPTARNPLEIFILYSGLHAVLLHKPAHFLYKHKFYFTARLLSQFSRFFTGIEIHPGSKIGKGLFIDHGMGVVIGETTIIGDDCTLYQGVTLGGTGKEKGKRHPTLGNNVMVGSGARILGPFRVGDNARIAAGAVVLKEVPENATAVGVPAKIAKIRKKSTEFPNQTMDQVHMPNPIEQEMYTLKRQMKELKKKIEALEKEKNKNENL